MLLYNDQALGIRPNDQIKRADCRHLWWKSLWVREIGANDVISAEPPISHLVVKRGHRGRYRLIFIHKDVRIVGEVSLQEIDRASKDHDEAALGRLKDAVFSLYGQLGAALVKP